MRRELMMIVASCTLTACLGPGPGAPDLSGPDNALPRYRVDGFVFDSLSGQPIADLDLRVGATRLHTDTFGRFSVEVDSGYVTFRLFDTDYEPPRVVFPHQGPQFVTLALRRYAPFLVNFRVVGDSIEGVIVDLQGRKTLDRWLVSRVIIDEGSASRTVLGTGMNWKAVDSLTYRTAVAATGVVHAAWDIHDVTGFSVLVDCDVGGRCTVLRSGFQSAVGG